MEQVTTQKFQAGTERQHRYLAVLARRCGYPSPLAVCAEVLGQSPEELLENPPDTTTARRVIEYLEKAGGFLKHGRSSEQHPTPGQLRQWAEAGELPSGLDEDSKVIVESLQQLSRIKGILSVGETQRVSKGVNGNSPIEVAHLLQFYGSWDTLADAFGITVATVKSWGRFVPENRVYEAEVRTNGYVRVPRDERGHVS